MLARDHRLRQPRDIARVYSRGKFGGAASLSAKVLSTGRPESRLAIVVSKKVSKKATVRNRIRRRLAAEIASQWKTLTPGYDIVVSVRTDISAAPAEQLSQHLQTALAKVGLLK